MHKLYMHHGVALRGGRANRSAKLGWQKERARPARSYCQPMMHFIFILQVDLVGNWLLYSISEETSSNLTRFLNLFNKFDKIYILQLSATSSDMCPLSWLYVRGAPSHFRWNIHMRRQWSVGNI